MSSPAAKLGLAPSSLDLASCLLELEQIKLAVALMAQLNLKPAFGGVVVLYRFGGEAGEGAMVVDEAQVVGATGAAPSVT